MKTFLQYVAEDIYDKMNGNFQDTTIVFPNKRATLFFNQFLWAKAEGKTIWTPDYTTISELFTSLSDHSIADPIYLICQLYHVYLQHNPATEKTFDDLYPFLEMMLADFQDIDSNLVPADKMFRNISDLQELTDYSFLEEEQREAISHFFNDLRWADTTTEKNNFKEMWEKLLAIYTDYQQHLLSFPDATLYEGMLKRLVIEPTLANNAEGTETSETISSRLTSKTYVFVGFNVLNKTEQELFKFIKKHKETFFYWDYDKSYCSGNPFTNEGKQYGFEAGMFIMENIRSFGSAFPESSEAYANMSRPKNITFIQSPTENAQSRYINKWVNENVKHGDDYKDTAIVLCNENLLQPVLHSIPNKLFDEDHLNSSPVILNVTMGYPLRETPVYSLIQALLELQLRGKAQSGGWRYKQVSAILKHPYIRRMTNGEANKTLTELTASNTIFPTDEAFKSNPLLASIFTKKSGNELTLYLAEILSHASVGIGVENSSDFDTQLYKESTFAAYTAINRIHNQQETLPALALLSDVSIARLITQALQRTTIPFHGEPANGIQVMGFLETRNLDFRNVIMLSAGEGQMPRANKRPSLIPYSLQVAFGMTTIEKEVSIYAYYFYRLLQRAENVTILWNSSVEEGNKGEMSRFLLQLLVESDQIFSPQQRINLISFVTPSLSMPIAPLIVEKNDEIMRRLHERFDLATEQQPEWKARHNSDYQLLLSPSAILCYLKCPLQFFFRYVARLRPDDEVSDEVDDAIFGDIFHYAMEQLYKPYEGKQLTSTQLMQMAKDNKLLQYRVDAGFMVKLFKAYKEHEEPLTLPEIKYSGAQLVKHHVLRKLLEIQLLADADTAKKAEENGGSFSILGLEEKHFVVREIQTDEPFYVRLGGIIDRIDCIDDGTHQTIRIVDYKTSSTPHEASNMEDMFKSDKIHGNYHITQTLYYCDVLTSEGKHGADTTPVVPAIMYYKKNKKLENAVVKMNCPNLEKKGNSKPFIQNYLDNCKEAFLPLLNKAINSIFQPGSFTQCEDDSTCKYCDFKLLCCRNPQKKY